MLLRAEVEPASSRRSRCRGSRSRGRSSRSALTNREEHATDAEYAASLAAKLFAFNLANGHAPLLAYVAFAARFAEGGCGGPGCAAQLSTLGFGVLFVAQLVAAHGLFLGGWLAARARRLARLALAAASGGAPDDDDAAAAGGAAARARRARGRGAGARARRARGRDAAELAPDDDAAADGDGAPPPPASIAELEWRLADVDPLVNDTLAVANLEAEWRCSRCGRSRRSSRSRRCSRSSRARARAPARVDERLARCRRAVARARARASSSRPTAGAARASAARSSAPTARASAATARCGRSTSRSSRGSPS